MSGYSQYAEEEAWQVAHQEAMECREVEAVLEVGLGIYRSIRKLTDGKEIDTDVLDLVHWWLLPCKMVGGRIKQMEARKFKVDGADDFRSYWAEAKQLSKLVPSTWRGQRILSLKEYQEGDFPYAPETE